jgi:methylase of polypeptide subunit release factors
MQNDQGLSITSLFAATAYFQNIRTIRDAAGHPRCVVAQLS